MRICNADWETSVWFGADPLHFGSIGGPVMLASDMTLLMGMYSGDHTDAAIISDRRAAPNAIGQLLSVPSRELVYKTLRLGPEVAIGFAGAVPMANYILARLLGLPRPAMEDDLLSRLVPIEDSFNYSYNDVVHGLNGVVEEVVQQEKPPAHVRTMILIAGMFGGDTPLLASLDRGTKWRVKYEPSAPYFAPFDKDDCEIKEAFARCVNAPGLDYGASLQAAVKFCADRYDNVNHNYVLRRLTSGFSREEGVV